MIDLAELDRKVKGAEVPAYDPRLAHIMDEAAYHHYAFQNVGHMYYVYLAKLVRKLRPRRVVELGTDIGRSALFMMTQLPAEAELWTVEVGPHEAIDLAPFRDDPRLHVVKGNDLDSQVIAQVGGEIDLLFIDTNHEFAQVAAEWLIYRDRLSAYGIAAFDDIHLNPGMERFWQGLEDPKHDCGNELHVSGFGLACPLR